MSASEPPPGVKWEGGQWVASDGRIWDGRQWRPPGPQIDRPWDAKPPTAPKRPMGTGKMALLVVGISVGVAVLLGIGLLSTGNRSRTPATDTGSDIGAWVVCQQAVDAQLKSPSTAEYPSRREASLSKSGDTWTYTSYVDAENSFGAQMRTPWTCTATHTSGENYNVRAVVG